MIINGPLLILSFTQNIVRACSMFYPYEGYRKGYRSVTARWLHASRATYIPKPSSFSRILKIWDSHVGWEINLDVGLDLTVEVVNYVPGISVCMYLFIYLFIYLFVYLLVYFIYLLFTSKYLYIYLFIYLFYLFIIYLFTFLFIIYLFIFILLFINFTHSFI